MAEKKRQLAVVYSDGSINVSPVDGVETLEDHFEQCDTDNINVTDAKEMARVARVAWVTVEIVEYIPRPGSEKPSTCPTCGAPKGAAHG